MWVKTLSGKKHQNAFREFFCYYFRRCGWPCESTSALGFIWDWSPAKSLLVPGSKLSKIMWFSETTGAGVNAFFHQDKTSRFTPALTLCTRKTAVIASSHQLRLRWWKLEAGLLIKTCVCKKSGGVFAAGLKWAILLSYVRFFCFFFPNRLIFIFTEPDQTSSLSGLPFISKHYITKV